MRSRGSHALTVIPVATRRNRREFLDLPKRLYRDDPMWIAPIEFELRQRLWGGNPYFQHAEMQAWLAYAGDRVVGRITAQFDRLQQGTHDDKVGAFGFLEAEDDPAIVAMLAQAAAGWLAAKGATRIRGPLNLSTNEECGLLIDGFDTPPSVMMGHARPYYDRLLMVNGFSKARDLVAYRVPPDFEAPKVMRRLAQSMSGQVKVRPIDTRRLNEELETLRDIFNDAWSQNYGMVPFTREEFADIGKLFTLLMPNDYVQIAEVDGHPGAFIVAMPNINEVAARMNGRLLPFGWLKLLWGLKVRHPRSARVSLMGVRKQYQHSRLGPGLAFMVIDAVRQGLCRMGVREVELSWILEDNAGMRGIIEAIGGDLYKRYRLYEKAI